jgi:hypothetical protein
MASRVGKSSSITLIAKSGLSPNVMTTGFNERIPSSGHRGYYSYIVQGKSLGGMWYMFMGYVNTVAHEENG